MSIMIEIANMASKALLYEVSLSPKPGLVDRYDNGAHEDMDFFLFVSSVQALSPFFEMYISAGYTHKGDMQELFTKIRKIGKKAEETMLKATNQINTHKGANFSFAIILGAVGYYIKNSNSSLMTLQESGTDEIFSIVEKMCKSLVSKDFSNMSNEKLTYGEKIYKEHGLTGIRGEAEAGYPTVREKALPFARKLAELDKEVLLLKVLLKLMTVTEDGNLIHRGGIKGWRRVQANSKDILERNETSGKLVHSLHEYNRELVNEHLSPGGAADLLAITIFFLFLENKID